MHVGTTKDQGLYNKPSAVVHPGALVAGTLPRYNTIRRNRNHLKGFIISIDLLMVLLNEGGISSVGHFR